MNHCYRLVFNKSTQVWQVVSEIAKSHSKSVAVVLLPLLGLFSQSYAWAEPAGNALPTGGQVVSGQSAITQNGNQLNIVQGSQKSIINWQSYNIGSNAEVNYIQNNANAISLNRVITGDPSAIFGKLNANGQVWLINPNGVLFGKGAQVNVGGLLASTLNIADDDFLGGKYQFTGSNGSVINLGAITASQGGYVAMLASEVRNEGVISAMQGIVALAAGNAITLDFNGNGLINVQVDSASVNTLVENKHLIQVGGGQVLMSTKAANGLITSVINNSGKIEANSMVNDGGVIRLTGAKTVINSGEISATSSSKKGGTVHLLGDNVGMFNSASVNVSGKTGGGTILMGGDFQGKNANIQNATKTFVGKDAKLAADATDNGDGGKVIVWADDITRYYGSTSVKGGALSGNGGFVEISGKRLLNFLGNVDLSAANGMGGNLLLDPTNITLSNGIDTNTNGFDAGVDNTQAFADDAGLDSVFNVGAGGSFAGISAGSTITLQATNDITIANAFNVATATGSANNSLVLEANNNINVNAALTLDGTGAVTLRADADNIGGGNLAINATVNTDIGGANLFGANITSISGANISTAGAANANGGNLNITASNSISLAGNISSSGGIASDENSGRNAGNISLNAVNSISTATTTASGTTGNGTNQNGGHGGTVSLTANTGITTGTIFANGSNATGTGTAGNAGFLSINNNDSTNAASGNITINGNIVVRNGNALDGLGGNAGSVVINNQANTGNITTNLINLGGSIAGNGGNLTINSEADVTLTANINTSAGTVTTGVGKNAGNINIVGVNRNINSVDANGGNAVGVNQAGGNAGAISITGTGTLDVAAINARTGAATDTGASGLVGSVNLTGTNITAADINTSGQANGNGGTISATASGLLMLNAAITSSGGAANSGSTGRNAGAITLSGNMISTATTINANGSNGSGANQGGGNAAAIMLNAVGNISTSTITANGGDGAEGNAKGGNAGSVSITTSTGNLSTDDLMVRTGLGSGTGADSLEGYITISNNSVAGTINVSSVDTRGQANGHGGSLTITGNNAVNISGSIRANAAVTTGNRIGGNGGNVSITGGSISTGTINTTATAGSGASQSGGQSGYVSINATSGGIEIGNITAEGGNGDNANGNGGNGGNVTLNAATGSNIIIQNINTTGGNRSGTGAAGMGGNITLADNAFLSTNTTLTSTGGNAGVGVGGAVNFNGSVNSSGVARTLTIISNGTTTFAGAIGNTNALSTLTTNATGSTVINGGSVRTTGEQTYNDAVTLGAATTFTTTNSNVNFASSINANSNNVVVAAGAGTLTATNTVNNFANLAVTASSADVRDANAIVLGATNVTGAYTLQTAGNITQTAALDVGGASTFNASATGDITLNTATNNFNSIAVTSARNVSLVDSNALTVNASTVASIAARTLTGNLTLGGNIAASGMGDAITLASAANFLNPGNSTLSTPSGRWLIYANTHTGNTFGGLISGNQAIYGRSFPTATAETGNRYVFANSPTLTFTSTDVAKNYGVDATAAVANGYEVTGFVNAATFGNVFTQDTVANTTTGAPTITSTGSVATASVAGSPYAITVDIAPVTFTNGYTGAAASTGELTVNAAVLTITANNQTKTYGDNFTFAGTEFTSTGLVNGETIGTVTLGSAAAVNTANVAGSPYDITINNALAGTFDANNYAISYVEGIFEVDPASLTIAANNATKIQGSANPTFSSTITGFVNGENDSVLIGMLEHTTPAVNSSPVGTYTITPSGFTADNYFISFVDGLLEVTSPVINSNLAGNISTFNNATTRPEQAVQTCNQQGASQAMINGLDEFGADDVDYQPSTSQPQVGGVIANGLAGASCSTL